MPSEHKAPRRCSGSTEERHLLPAAAALVGRVRWIYFKKRDCQVTPHCKAVVEGVGTGVLVEPKRVLCGSGVYGTGCG